MDRLRLRRVSEADCELLFAWANDGETRRNSFRTEKIEYEEHAAWFRRKMREDSCQMFILLCAGKEAGQIRLDWQDGEEVARISYVIAPVYRGRGLGSEILRLVEPFACGKVLQGRVRRENLASAKCFQKNGYAMAEREHWLEFSKKIA
jgi:Acetyltransferases, including N-acetylases of ribosomal proteins